MRNQLTNIKVLIGSRALFNGLAARMVTILASATHITRGHMREGGSISPICIERLKRDRN